ncbi:YqiA/YcfP family alpha/beta fold hydrolase [Comamonas flocculans]|uniref:Esterase n=1 Tax=Comamonas flocculans TaxID=2597701 RepID=A0A5B8RU16_9BURK|nr:YqiA/YcfP family alpha/beta fold hydrolase [Comamonas flocculans]QEA12212.1 esterase [Comamonas flocculans]
MTTTHLLYLHGFRSSPQSTKARMVAAAVAARHPGVSLWCPQLPPSPAAAMDKLLQGVRHWPGAAMAVIGSSLGGYYASRVAHEKRCASVLLNPAVDPARDLARHIGEQAQWHDPQQHFFFAPRYIDELRALDLRGQPPAGPELLLAARGDEVLDWREMLARYPQARQIVLEGGDHALSNFADWLDEVLAFCRLA